MVAGCFGAPKSASIDLVSAEKYRQLIVEIDYANDQKPRPGSVDLLEQRIGERLSKPDGTTVRETSFVADRSVYSNDDLRELESRQRQNSPGGNTMVLYVLFLNGHHAEDTSNEKVLGVQYGRASIAIFKETIDTSTGLFGLFAASEVERSVLIHEFGHAMGLVNNGLKMVNNHEDPQHPAHSNNEDSVMYWAVETTLGLPGLDTIPNDFDANDIADIRAGGGR